MLILHFIGLIHKRIYINKVITDKDTKLLKLLNSHPILRSRVEALIAIVEDSDETIEKADDAEQRVIEEVRKIGHVALSKWAECKNKRNKTELKKRSDLRIAGKKLWWHSTFHAYPVSSQTNQG